MSCFAGGRANLVNEPERVDSRESEGLPNNLSSQIGPKAIPPIVGRALLVSKDSTIVEGLLGVMHQFAIAVEVCRDVPTAATLIHTRKFESIIVDLVLGGPAAQLIERIRFSPSNSNCVTFALLDSAQGAELKTQPNFVIPKPFDDKQVRSMLKAALGLIIRDYRRYFRCPLTVPVLIDVDSKVQIPCQMMNISEGGLAITTTVNFDPGVTVKAEFTLPDASTVFSIDAEICWCDKKGCAGLHFRLVSPDQLVLLQDWLSQKIEQRIPEPVARLFRKLP